MTTSSYTQSKPTLRSLINEFWFTENKDPQLAKFQKNRWYYLTAYILLEISLAVITFFATISFGVFMSAVEVGSMALFSYYAPILAALLMASVCTYVGIRFFAKKASDLWKSYISAKELNELANTKLLKNMKYYAKENTQPALLINNLSNSVGDLFEVSTTVITALIQFIPCLIILLMLNPMLPWLSIVICSSIMLICYKIAQIMNESQTAYMSADNQFISEASELISRAPGYGIQEKLVEHQKIKAIHYINESQRNRNQYRRKKGIFDFFAIAAEKIIMFGPYIIFGYFAIIGNLPMAVFTLMVTTFIQACMHLMKINEIHSTIVKINATTDQISAYQNLKKLKITPEVKYETIASNHAVGSSKKTTAVLNVSILDQGSIPDYYYVVDENHVQVFNKTTLSFEKEKTQLDIKEFYQFSNEQKPCKVKEPKSLIGKKVFLKKEYLTNFYIKDMMFHAGDRIWVNGPSGVGKSLFLGILNGLNTLGWGTVQLPEKNECIFIPQTPSLNERSTIKDQLLAELPQNKKKRYTDKALMELFEENMNSKVESSTPMKRHHGKTMKKDTALLDQPISSLSGGERNKLVMMRLLLQDPKTIKLITLDEPFAACPNDEPELIGKIIDHFKEATILFISHASKGSPSGDYIQKFVTKEISLKSANATFNKEDRPKVNYEFIEYRHRNNDSIFPPPYDPKFKTPPRRVGNQGLPSN